MQGCGFRVKMPSCQETKTVVLLTIHSGERAAHMRRLESTYKRAVPTKHVNEVMVHTSCFYFLRRQQFRFRSLFCPCTKQTPAKEMRQRPQRRNAYDRQRQGGEGRQKGSRLQVVDTKYNSNSVEFLHSLSPRFFFVVSVHTRRLLSAIDQSELQTMYSGLGADMDSAFETQGQLEDQKKEVSARCCLASTFFYDFRVTHHHAPPCCVLSQRRMG